MTELRAIVEHDVTVHQGHVTDVLPKLAAGSVQCIVTSPPYYGLRDYGVDGQLGLEASPAEYVESMRAVFAECRRVLAADGVLWLNIGDSYASKTKGQGGGSGKSTLGVSADGTVRMNENGRRLGVERQEFQVRTFDLSVPEKNLLGIPWRVAFALQDDGWTLRNAVIWSKPNAMPESVTDRLSCRYEHVFLFSKSRRYTFDLDAIREAHAQKSIYQQDVARRRPHDQGKGYIAGESKAARADGLRELAQAGRNPGDVWSIPTSPYAGAHFATMPPELARRCILAGCPEGGTVLDPFAGSGTTLMVARKLGRKSVGVELNPASVDLIRQRIGQTPFDFGEATA